MLRLEMMDVNDLINNVDYLIRDIFGKQVQSSTILCPRPKKIKGDQGELTQVVLDIVQNACDAMPDGGKLMIQTENILLDEEQCKTIPESRPGSFVCISITDTGSGMDKETLEHIFEPFFTTKPAGKATGLGLAFVYGTVKQHKGWLQVSSQLEKGSTFKVYLPDTSGSVDEPEHALLLL